MSRTRGHNRKTGRTIATQRKFRKRQDRKSQHAKRREVRSSLSLAGADLYEFVMPPTDPRLYEKL